MPSAKASRNADRSRYPNSSVRRGSSCAPVSGRCADEPAILSGYERAADEKSASSSVAGRCCVGCCPACRCGTGEYNGSGLLIYRGEPMGRSHPVPSIRLKAHRRGFQDYEYFWLLERAGRICRRCSRGCWFIAIAGSAELSRQWAGRDWSMSARPPSVAPPTAT